MLSDKLTSKWHRPRPYKLEKRRAGT